METKRFPWGKTFLLGFGFLGISIIWPIFNQYIPLFLQAGNPEFERLLLEQGRDLPTIVGFGMAPSLAMFIMTWDNLLNMFIAPWAGSASDRTWNRLGRRKMWILIGAPIALLGFVFVPLAQTALAIMIFILITNFGMALFRSPTVSWLGDLFNRDDRSKANGVINLMGGIGGLLAYFGSGMIFNALEGTSPEMARLMPFVAGGIATIVALATVIIFVKEPRTLPGGEDKEKANMVANLRTMISNPDKSGIFVLVSILFWFMAFYALETGLSSFAVFSLGMKPGTASIYAGLVTISFIAFSIPAGFLGTRFGRGSIIRVGLAGLVVVLLFGFFFIKGPTVFAVVLILAGGFWALVNVNSLPLVYDHGDERRIGAFTGLYYFSSQLAAVLGPTLGGVLVDALGSEYRWLWLFSVGFMILAFLTMLSVRRGEAKPAAG
ncbi:MAG: MFS transporter [Chloroflexota bacterium]